MANPPSVRSSILNPASLDREQRGAPRLAVALLDAVDSALRHAKKAPELGLAPAERRTRHTHGRGDEEAIALLPIAMLATGLWPMADSAQDRR